MVKKLWVLLLLPSLGLMSCGGGGSGSVSGKLKNAKGKTVVLEVVENNVPRAVDSAEVGDDGSFSLKLPYGKRSFYRIKSGPGSMIIVCTDSTENLEIGGDALRLYETYTVKGSKASESIKTFFSNTDPINKDLLAMEQEMRGFNPADTAAGMALGKKYNTRRGDLVNYVKKFIDENPKSPACYLTIGYLNWQADMDYFKKVEKALSASMPGSEYQNYITSQISSIEYQQQQMAEMEKQNEAKMDALRKKLAPGTTPPDIKYANPQGKVIALSSLKGKYVLIDFWASWCRPCRAENPNVVRLYNQYKDKGFTVYSVSLDKEKSAWINAIDQDGLIWPNHVSELQYWSSSVVKDYSIEGIPFTMLLDKEGKIIDIGLRGLKLEEKLKELIGS